MFEVEACAIWALLGTFMEIGQITGGVKDGSFRRPWIKRILPFASPIFELILMYSLSVDSGTSHSPFHFHPLKTMHSRTLSGRNLFAFIEFIVHEPQKSAFVATQLISKTRYCRTSRPGGFLKVISSRVTTLIKLNQTFNSRCELIMTYRLPNVSYKKTVS
jgi:hypothetical protein